MGKNLGKNRGIVHRAQFIKVVGEDGAFYDLIFRRKREEHLKELEDSGYLAVPVNAEDVPSCKYRNFTAGLPGTYIESLWKTDNEDIDFYDESERYEA